jgi:peptidoglycan hydrolase-like protein with peptidoglycan-binding domain
MKLGDKGPGVEHVQTLLIRHGYDVKADGDFGPKTKKAVEDFQTDHGLISDGNVGLLTLNELEKDNFVKPVSSSFEFGKAYTPSDFDAYVKNVKWVGWKPSLIVIHHCAEPNLAQRPHGFEYQHMLNIKDFYKSKGWSAGPHLFIDDDQIWTFSPLTAKGIHAVSFNSTGIGIEMLGDYDSENPKEGRGWDVIQTTVKAVKSLMKYLGLNKSCVRFHRDDPKTSKTCPGTKISKEWFLSLL